MLFGLRWYGPTALAVFLVATLLMVFGVDPFYSHYYDFAWYCYIAFMDSLVYRFRGRSLLSNRFGEFLLMLPLSWFVWEIFEGFNLRLENWHYVKITPEGPIPYPYEHWKLPLYFIAFATVLPANFITLEMVRVWSRRSNNWLHRVSIRPWQMTQTKFDLFILIGLLCLSLPMMFPQQAFPLIWLAFFFLLDPINFRAGRPSLLHAMSKGRLSLFLQILVAGMICGCFWEFWNFWAGIKWVYTVPAPFDKMKIFEMPCLGFLGFPAFALACYALYHFLRGLPGIRLLATERSMFAYELPEPGATMALIPQPRRPTSAK